MGVLESGQSGQLLAQYGWLRDEMLKNEDIQMQLLQSSGILVAGILTVAYATSVDAFAKGALFVLAAMVAAAAMAQSLDRIITTFKIASYMRVFLENDPNLECIKWEMRQRELRRKHGILGYGQPVASSIVIYSVMIFGSLLALGVHLFQTLKSELPAYQFAGLIGWLIVFLLAVRFVERTRRERDRFVTDYNESEQFDQFWIDADKSATDASDKIRKQRVLRQIP